MSYKKAKSILLTDLLKTKNSELIVDSRMGIP
jgi:hypothetical protein